MEQKMERNKRQILQQLQSFQLAGVQEWSRAMAEQILALPDDTEASVSLEGISSRSAVLPVPPHDVAERRSVDSNPQSIQEISMQKPSHAPPASSKEAESSKLPALQDRKEALLLLAEKVRRCTDCLELVSSRTQTVLGTGNPYARLMFIGEAPGAEEDKQGVPFVGRAGKLLSDMIEKGMKLSRSEETYICNILRCRPPRNRAPLPMEAANCRKFLDLQIEIVKPEFICCLGASAAQFLLSSTTTISRMRGREYDYRGIRVVCTYHPAYLLRNPSQKAATWEDLQFLMRIMSDASQSGTKEE